MKKNLIFIGLRGSGKSHIGSVFAKKHGFDFVDTDQEVEIQAGKTIPEIVQEGGWEEFRRQEEEVCRSVSKNEKIVISTGGGVIMNTKNVEALQENGIFIFLFVPLKELHRRLARSKTKRPPLKPGLSMEEEIVAVWDERKETFYEVADVVFKQQFFSENPHENVRKNVEKLEEELQKAGII